MKVSVSQTAGGQESIGKVMLQACITVLFFPEYFLFTAARERVFGYFTHAWCAL